MARGNKSRSILLGGLVLVASIAAAPLAAAAEPAAIEEYVLTRPGVETAGVADEQAGGTGELAAPAGVTGERRTPDSALGTIGSAALSPGGVILLAALLAALGLGLGRRRIPR